MNENNTNANSFRPRKISWLTIVLGLLTIISFIAISNQSGRYYTPMATGGGMMENSGGTVSIPPSPAGMPMREGSVSNVVSQDAKGSSVYYPAPYPYYNPDVPVTDTREFLKLNYGASMRTRDVQGLTQRVETTVRGYGGRIDQESSSQQWGTVSFALPQSKFDAFRTELESLVNKRLISVNLSSQNLLPQKQNIEAQQKQADTTLADYKTARQKIVSVHTSAVQSLQSKIDADAAQLVQLRTQPSTPDLEAKIQTVTNDWNALKQQLANENSSYTKQLSNADANIKYAQDWQKAVQTQDQTLLDNVATVTGTVSIQWISLWDLAQVFLPGYWIPFIFLALTILSFLWDRRRFGTM